MVKTFKVGLTGGIGSGKSTVLRFISENKIPVLQTDLVGHELLNQKEIKNKLVLKFGSKIVDKRGLVDRRELGRSVFNRPSDQKWLNQLLHPIIRKRVAVWIGKQEKQLVPLVVVEVPLLFERGFYRRFNGVLSVSSPASIRVKRLLKAGWSRADISKREKFQWSQTRKNQNADWVIFNRNSLKDLKYRVDQWLKRLPIKGKISHKT